MEPILRGREAALHTLRAKLEDALGGRGGVALVSGEPGIGKSALVATLARDAEARGAALTWGRAWEFADAPPYFPLWPCLRALGIDVERDTHERQDAHVFHLWERLLLALARAASNRPAVWVLEDLHAADLGTLDVLTFLAQPARAMRVLVIGTVRRPDPRLTDRMLQRFTRIARDGIDVPLDPLSNADVAALTEATTGRPVPAKELQRLVELTGGNPLFVVECARAFRAAGGIEGTLGSLPPTVRQVVFDRFSLLPGATREALACGAVLGREFSASSVAMMRASLPARVIDALLPALRSGLLHEPSPARFVFSHAIVRDAIEESLDADERAKLHGAADAALGAQDETADVVVERARHAIAALRCAPSTERVLALSRRALALLARDSAFDRAIELHARLDEARAAGFLSPASADERLDAAGIARAAGRSDVSRRICEEVLARARAAGDPVALARAALLHAADVRPGVMDRTQVSVLEEILAALGDHHPDLRCLVLARLATALMPARDPSVPIRLTREAIALARTLPTDDALLDVLELAAWGLYSAPLEERIALVTELCDRALAKAALTKAIAGHVMLAHYHVEASDFDAFARTVETLLALSEAVGHPRHRWRALLLASMRATMLGHFAESERYVTEVTQLASLVDEPALPWTLGLHEIFRARAQRRDDELRQRLIALAEILRDDVDAPIFAALIRATCAARAEDADATRVALAAIGSGAASILGDPSPAPFLAEAYALAGSDADRRTAREALGRTPRREISGEVMSFVYEGPLVRILGLLDAALGEFEAAERALREALALATARRHLPWVAQTAYELAKVVGHLGREADARALLNQSRSIAHDLGMPGLERGAGADAADEAPAAGGAVAMSKQGAEYRIVRGGSIVRVKDSRGMQLLARLVERPLDEIHVLALASDEPTASVPESSAGEVLDEAAKRAYRARVSELDEDLAEAKRLGDAPRAAKLEKENTALLAELTRAMGLGGRARQAGSATERARVNVQRRLRDAVAKIAEADPDLGRFFERSIRTGTFCSFRPR